MGVVDSVALWVAEVSRWEVVGPACALLLFNASNRSWFDLESQPFPLNESIIETRWKKLPERSDTTANFLRRLGGRGRRLFLFLVILQLLLLLLLRLGGRLLDRLRRGRLRLKGGFIMNEPASRNRSILRRRQLTAGAADFLPTLTRPLEDSNPPNLPEPDLAGAGVTGAAAGSSS